MERTDSLVSDVIWHHYFTVGLSPSFLLTYPHQHSKSGDHQLNDVKLHHSLFDYAPLSRRRIMWCHISSWLHVRDFLPFLPLIFEHFRLCHLASLTTSMHTNWNNYLLSVLSQRERVAQQDVASLHKCLFLPLMLHNGMYATSYCITDHRNERNHHRSSAFDIHTLVMSYCITNHRNATETLRQSIQIGIITCSLWEKELHNRM